MLLVDVEMRKILQILGLLDICFSGVQIRAWRPFLLQGDIRELKMFYKKRQLPFFPTPNMNTMPEVMVDHHPRGTAGGEGAGGHSSCPSETLNHWAEGEKGCQRLGI